VNDSAAQGEYLLLLNPDTLVHPHALDALCAFLHDNPDVDACGPRLLNEDGTVQASARGLPTFRSSLHRHTILRYFLVFRRQHRQWRMSGFQYDRQMDVDQLMGAALLLRRSALDQVGRMDERFFLYFEEVDLCHRLKQAGRRIVFMPGAAITHLCGESSRQVPVAAQIMLLNSLLKYLRKHRGRVATGLFNCIFKPGVVAKWFCDLVAGLLLYLASWLTCNPARRRKAAVRVRTSAVLLARHSWWLLFQA
jgi:GT2 family glycosyltransferase